VVVVELMLRGGVLVLVLVLVFSSVFGFVFSFPFSLFLWQKKDLKPQLLKYSLYLSPSS